jgi:CRP-like cAMP-binding protein
MDSQASDISNKVAEFFKRYPLRTFDKRQVMVQAEEPLPGIFYLTEGRVSQYDITPAGNEVVVNVFKPKAFFPMSAAINGTPNHYFFEASTKVMAHLAPAADAVQFLKDNPDVLFDLLARVYRGTDGVLRRMSHLMGSQAKTRLLFEVLNAAYRFGEPAEGGAVFVPLKESDLARQSGLARETVNRTLQNLKSSGMVDIKHTGITIQSLEELENILGTDL